jgi:hypothetical protein
MYILNYLHKNKLESLGYDTIFLEQPVPNIYKNINWKNILLPPPSNLSKITYRELQLLSQLTQSRTQKDIQLVYNIDKDMDTPFELLCKSYEVEYPRADIKAFYDLIRPILLNVKGYYNRPRPAQLAKYLNIPIDVIVTDTHHTASYPSGHTVYSKLSSLILKDRYSQIDQTKLDNIVNIVKRARMLQGVHYPSDCDASLLFTTVLFNETQGSFR